LYNTNNGKWCDRYVKEMFDDTKGIIRSEEGQAIQWPNEKGQTD